MQNSVFTQALCDAQQLGYFIKIYLHRGLCLTGTVVDYDDTSIHLATETTSTIIRQEFIASIVIPAQQLRRNDDA